MEQSIVCDTPEKVSALRLIYLKLQLKLESKGLRSSGGAIRPRIAAEFGLKPRASYDAYINAVEQKLAQIRSAR